MSRACLLLLSLLAWSGSAWSAELTVYSARVEALIKPVFDRYTAETGTQIRYITDKEGPLLQRLRAEGASSPADLLITVDAGNLWQAAKIGVLQPVESEVLQANVPAHLRDADNRWFGVSIRARTAVYNPNKLKAKALTSYEDLADKKWKGRLCLRTSKKVYNQSLVAMMLEQHGAEHTEAVVRGWVANLAAPPFASDNEVLDAIAAGRCDVGLVNTYYYGRKVRKDPELPLRLHWLNQDPQDDEIGGLHVNVSGAGVTRHSPNRSEAVKFLEWLSTPKTQALFSALNLEFPVNPSVQRDPVTAHWGQFQQDDTPLYKAGERQADAVRLMDRAGYR